MKLPDAVIWASALSNGLLLITRDAKDFMTEDPGVRVPYNL
jgi:predicted nucleic acid-binding protein